MMTTFSIERRKLSLAIQLGKHGQRKLRVIILRDEFTRVRAAIWKTLATCGARLSEPLRHTLVHTIIFVPTSFPFSHAPENNSKEERAATIHADGVAEFISSSGVVQRINRNVS